MRELVSESGANLIAASLSVIVIMLGAVYGVSQRRLKFGLAFGFGLGVLNLLLWLFYNAVVKAAGLDSFWALVMMVILFALIGCGVGYATAKFGKGINHESPK